MHERYEKRNDLLARGVDKRLRERRKLLGWSQRELGERCGNATQATIAKIEAGVTIYPNCIEDLADALGVSPGWLQFGDEGVDWSRDVADLATRLTGLSDEQRDVIRKIVYDYEALNERNLRAEELKCG